MAHPKRKISTKLLYHK